LYSYTVSAFADAGTPIGTANATDEDFGTYGQFTYSLDQRTMPGNYFKVQHRRK